MTFARYLNEMADRYTYSTPPDPSLGVQDYKDKIQSWKNRSDEAIIIDDFEGFQIIRNPNDFYQHIFLVQNDKPLAKMEGEFRTLADGQRYFKVRATGTIVIGKSYMQVMFRYALTRLGINFLISDNRLTAYAIKFYQRLISGNIFKVSLVKPSSDNRSFELVKELVDPNEADMVYSEKKLWFKTELNNN